MEKNKFRNMLFYHLKSSKISRKKKDKNEKNNNVSDLTYTCAKLRFRSE